MKVVILCGGKGTRLREETEVKPKPMVEVGGKPILWHIMNIYAFHRHKEFFLALGYKGGSIKEYFLNYYHHQSDLTIQLKTGKVSVKNGHFEDWNVHLMDTGEETLTGGRLYRLRDSLQKETFMVTYGDGVSDVDIKKLISFHKSRGKIATVTAVRPVARFGGLTFDGDRIVEFKEKPQTGEGWINGGFFVFEPEIFDYLCDEDDTVLEGAPLETLARKGQLVAYKHEGFWQCMDTLRDKQLLEKFWDDGDAPWKVWKTG